MAQSGIAPGQRDAEARPEIFREIGVVSGREEQPPLCAISPGGETERALGRDMDRFGREVVQPLCEPVPNTDREPDPRFGGATYRSKQIRGQRQHWCPAAFSPSCNAASVRAAPLTGGA